MKTTCSRIACGVLAATASTLVSQAAVTAGNSSLIGELDYSDSFTIGPGSPIAARQGYPAQQFTLPAGVDEVENNYGNPARFWGSTPFSIATDGANNPGAFGYPGGSGAGSATGFTQRGGGGDWSIEYGLRDEFVLQSDFVHLPDRVDFTIGATPATIFGAGNLSIFFRTSGHPQFPEIGLFNGSQEIDTGLTSGIPADNAWHNYAVRVDVPNDLLEVYVDEVSRGIIDLNTIGGGAYNDILNNKFVGIGGAGADRLWSDNFQVGGVIPEPSTALLGLLGVGLVLRRQRR